MFDVKRLQIDFSRAAEHYDSEAEIQHYALSRLLFKVLPLAKDAATILDAGCGTGRLAQLWPDPRIVQLDIAFGMCAKARGTGQPTVNGAVETLPFADGTFDCVFSALALQWVDDRPTAMAEMRRVLRPGGVLGVATLGSGTLAELRESFRAADSHAHVSDFSPRKASWQAEQVTQHYESFFDLLRHLKAVGARHKMRSGRKGLMTREALARAEAHYEAHFREEAGLAASWEILYRIERKS